jgi:hypothetical protein
MVRISPILLAIVNDVFLPLFSLFGEIVGARSILNLATILSSQITEWAVVRVTLILPRLFI